MADPARVAVLISGRGSNMQALVEAASSYSVVLVASNAPQAPGIDWARERGLPTWAFDSRNVKRDLFDQYLSDALEDHGVGTIALAGYMRLLSPSFIRRWRGRIINIHPSLLPKYRGLDTHARAIDAGDAVSGCTVHVVEEEVDSGEILGSAEVEIRPGDTPERLAERIRREEHRLYPGVLAAFVKARKG